MFDGFPFLVVMMVVMMVIMMIQMTMLIGDVDDGAI